MFVTWDDIHCIRFVIKYPFRSSIYIINLSSIKIYYPHFKYHVCTYVIKLLLHMSSTIEKFSCVVIFCNNYEIISIALGANENTIELETYF